ncbi:nicotinamide mononucleotide permease [Colletotrichum asianum]
MLVPNLCHIDHSIFVHWTEFKVPLVILIFQSEMQPYSRNACNARQPATNCCSFGVERASNSRKDHTAHE